MEYLKKINLDKERIGDGIRALLKLRYWNMEKENKYWLGNGKNSYILCGERKDCMEHYVKECAR